MYKYQQRVKGCELQFANHACLQQHVTWAMSQGTAYACHEHSMIQKRCSGAHLVEERGVKQRHYDEGEHAHRHQDPVAAHARQRHAARQVVELVAAAQPVAGQQQPDLCNCSSRVEGGKELCVLVLT